jgi:serine/arginine repetitive matrix protein 2
MSYNNIGLPTPRGTGTNGYIQANLSSLLFSKNKTPYNTEADIEKAEAEVNRGPNPELLDHEYKRTIEIKCVEFEDLMEGKGFNDEEIQAKVSEYRKLLFNEFESGNMNMDKELDLRNSHSRAKVAKDNRNKMRNALGIDAAFVDGSSLEKLKKASEAVLNAAATGKVDKEALDKEMEKSMMEKLLEKIREKNAKKKKGDESSSSSSSTSSDSSDSDSTSTTSSSSTSSSSSEEKRRKKKNKTKRKHKQSEKRKHQQSKDVKKETRDEESVRSSPKHKKPRNDEGRESFRFVEPKLEPPSPQVSSRSHRHRVPPSPPSSSRSQRHREHRSPSPSSSRNHRHREPRTRSPSPSSSKNHRDREPRSRRDDRR